MNKPDTKEQILYNSIYMGVPRVIRFIEVESKMMVIEHWEEISFIGYRILVWDDVKVLEMDNGDVCTTLQIILNDNYTLIND